MVGVEKTSLKKRFEELKELSLFKVQIKVQ
jgi:hypothetical protein